MVLAEAVQWWEEWQLRILVLGSLSFQFFLFVAALLRKRNVPTWFRFLTWLAYQGSDAVAMYGLAALYYRHRKQKWLITSSDDLEVLWTPVLLLHLGGHDGITAYNIEDNELWKRRVVIAVSQVAVAIYVFFKTWSGDKGLLLVGILVLIPGIHRCLEYPWALKNATIKCVVSATSNLCLCQVNYVESAKKCWNTTFKCFVRPRSTSCSSPSTGERSPVSEGQSSPSTGTRCTEETVQVKGTLGLAEYLKSAKNWLVPPVAGAATSPERSTPSPVQPPVQEEAHPSVQPVKIEEAHPSVQPVKKEEVRLEVMDPTVLFGDIAYSYDYRLEKLKEVVALSRQEKEPGKTDGKVNQLKKPGKTNGKVEQLKKPDGEAHVVDLSRPVQEEEPGKTYGKVNQLKKPGKTNGKVEQRKKPDGGNRQVEELMQRILFRSFDRFYTKDRRDSCFLVHVLLRIVPYCLTTIAAIILFHRSQKGAYDGADVKITYTLLYCTAALDLLLLVIGSLKVLDFKWWPHRIAQYNLVWYLDRNKRHAWVRNLATMFVSKDHLDELWCMRPCHCASDIIKLVYDHVKEGWEEHIEIEDSSKKIDPAQGSSTSSTDNDALTDKQHAERTYRNFNDSRGKITLKKINLEQDFSKKNNKPLTDSDKELLKEKMEGYLMMPFDESVLLWHIATHFCDHYSGASRRRRVAVEMSNYMAYLLAVNPEMLMAGTRRSLFRDAYKELKHMLGDQDQEENRRELPRGRDELQAMIVKFDERISKDKFEAQHPRFVLRGWDLAKALLALEKEKMWTVVQGVWVEMLCFSASNCRGYLHAKSMGEGGEYLSYVWLLLAHMGMETLPDRLQRPPLTKTAKSPPSPPSTTTKLE